MWSVPARTHNLLQHDPVSCPSGAGISKSEVWQHPARCQLFAHIHNNLTPTMHPHIFQTEHTDTTVLPEAACWKKN